MTTSKIYKKDEFWCVDFYDENYDMLPSVGLFRELQDARQAALVWAQGDAEKIELISKKD